MHLNEAMNQKVVYNINCCQTGERDETMVFFLRNYCVEPPVTLGPLLDPNHEFWEDFFKAFILKYLFH